MPPNAFFRPHPTKLIAFDDLTNLTGLMDTDLFAKKLDVGDVLYTFIVTFTMLGDIDIYKTFSIYAITHEVDADKYETEEEIKQFVDGDKYAIDNLKDVYPRHIGFPLTINIQEFINRTESVRGEYPLSANKRIYTIKEFMDVQTGPLSWPKQKKMITIIHHLPDVLILYKKFPDDDKYDMALHHGFWYNQEIKPDELIGSYAYIKNEQDKQKRYMLKGFIIKTVVQSKYCYARYDNKTDKWRIMDSVYLTNTATGQLSKIGDYIKDTIQDDATLFFFVESSKQQKRTGPILENENIFFI
jgi:hypothetical protein